MIGMRRGKFVARMAPLLLLASCGGGGGGGGDDGGPDPTPPPVAETGFDYPRLAAAMTTVQATYVGGMGGGVGSLRRIETGLGDAQACPGGGSFTLTSRTNNTGDAQYVMQACVLAVLPTVSFTGIAATGDISIYGTMASTGQALGMPASFTFTKGSVEGTPSPRTTGTYSIQNDLFAGTFLAGSNPASYSVDDSHILGSQTGTGTGATVQLASGSGRFSVKGRQLTYSISSPIAWSVNGPTGGRLVVNAPSDNPPDSKTYVFGAGGSVQVLDVYGTSIGSFLWSGVAFQAALSAANN